MIYNKAQRKLLREGEKRVNDPNYEPVFFGDNEVLDKHIVVINNTYIAAQDNLKDLQPDVQRDVYRRAGELNAIEKRKFPSYSNDPLDKYIEFNKRDCRYQKKITTNDEKATTDDKCIMDRIDYLNGTISNEELAEHINRDDTDDKKKKQKKKKHNKQNNKQLKQNEVKQVNNKQEDIKEQEDPVVEEYKKDIIAWQEENENLYERKIKPVLSDEFIKSLDKMLAEDKNFTSKNFTSK